MLPDDPRQSSDIEDILIKDIDKSFKHKLHRFFVCKLFVDLIALFPSLFHQAFKFCQIHRLHRLKMLSLNNVHNVAHELLNHM